MNKQQLELLIDLVNAEIQDITDFLHGYTIDYSSKVEEVWIAYRLAYKNVLKILQKMLTEIKNNDTIRYK